MASTSRPCFWKMPALLPRWTMALSQLPRWPIVALSASAAVAAPAETVSAAAAMMDARVGARPIRRSFSGLRARAAGADPADQRVRADRDHENDDEQRVHARHVERAVAVDHEEADAAVRQFGLGEQRPDDRDAEPEPDAVDDRHAHRRQIYLAHHLPGASAKAAAHPDQHLVDLAHAGRG